MDVDYGIQDPEIARMLKERLMPQENEKIPPADIMGLVAKSDMSRYRADREQQKNHALAVWRRYLDELGIPMDEELTLELLQELLMHISSNHGDLIVNMAEAGKANAELAQALYTDVSRMFKRMKRMEKRIEALERRGRR